MANTIATESEALITSGKLKIGDKVSYPMHGAGVIDSTEEVDIMGEKKTYYVLKLPMGNMKVMIPMEGSEKLGLRAPLSEEAAAQVLSVWQDKPEHTVGSWNKRFQSNLTRMKSGDLCDVAAVARNLTLQDRDRRISSGERRLLELSRQILVSELSFALSKEPPEVEAMLEKLLKDRHKKKA